MERLTLADWRLINEALALFQTEHETYEPDEFASDDEYETWNARMEFIEDVRLKVHDRAKVT